MKKRILLISLTTCTLLSGAQSLFVNPLPNQFKSIENGGILPAIDAYSDGVGAVIQDYKTPVENSAMNSLVFIYGEAAKENGVSLPDQVLLSGTPSDIQKAGKFFVDGASCNDNNSNTSGETYLNGVCQGGLIVDGTSCNDNNIQTIQDKYFNQICTGNNVEGTSCSDGNDITVNDKYTNGVCSGQTNPLSEGAKSIVVFSEVNMFRLSDPQPLNTLYIAQGDPIFLLNSSYSFIADIKEPSILYSYQYDSNEVQYNSELIFKNINTGETFTTFLIPQENRNKVWVKNTNTIPVGVYRVNSVSVRVDSAFFFSKAI